MGSKRSKDRKTKRSSGEAGDIMQGGAEQFEPGYNQKSFECRKRDHGDSFSDHEGDSSKNAFSDDEEEERELYAKKCCNCISSHTLHKCLVLPFWGLFMFLYLCVLCTVIFHGTDEHDDLKFLDKVLMWFHRLGAALVPIYLSFLCVIMETKFLAKRNCVKRRYLLAPLYFCLAMMVVNPVAQGDKKTWGRDHVEAKKQWSQSSHRYPRIFLVAMFKGSAKGKPVTLKNLDFENDWKPANEKISGDGKFRPAALQALFDKVKVQVDKQEEEFEGNGAALLKLLNVKVAEKQKAANKTAKTRYSEDPNNGEWWFSSFLCWTAFSLGMATMMSHIFLGATLRFMTPTEAAAEEARLEREREARKAAKEAAKNGSKKGSKKGQGRDLENGLGEEESLLGIGGESPAGHTDGSVAYSNPHVGNDDEAGNNANPFA